VSLDTVYADSIEQNLRNWAANPGPEPQPSFSLTSFIGAGLTAFPSAALDVGGFGSDVLSGFGTASAASGGSAGGMFSLPTAAEAKQEEQARQRMLTGNAFDVAGGNAARRKADEFAPDPLTSHAADQVMHGLVRFGAKAAVAVGTMGPAGALVLGAEEGNAAAQGLIEQGVAPPTAAKVGGVQGVIAGASAVVPLGGRTIAQTLGLVAVGGPGSYVTQEHLSRRILEEAGYLDQASLHNPFDPLGLALSTVIPAGFGALHLRGEAVRGKAVEGGTLPLAQLRPEELRSLKYDDPRLDAYAAKAAEANGVPPALLLAIKNVGEKSGPTAVSGKGATGVMQFMAGTAKEMGLADRTDPVASIDAGARYIKKLYDAYGSWDAAVAHYNGGGTQAALVRSGGAPTAKETIGYLSRVRQYMADHTAETAARNPDAVDAARVAVLNDTVGKSLPDTPDAHAQMLRAADIVGESGGRAAEQQIAPAGLDVFHGTKAADLSIEDLSKTLDLGPHFTTSRETAELFANSEGTPGRVLQGVARFEKPLELPDLNGWFPTRVAQAIDEARGAKPMADGQTQLQAHVWAAMEKAKAEFFDAQSEEYQAIRSQIAGLSAEQKAMKSRVFEQGMEKSQQAGYEAVRQELRKEGYDSIRYKNQNEGAPVDTYIALESGRVTSKAQADQPPIPRAADNALPPHDSVSIAGDEPAKPGAELGSAPREATEPPAAAKPQAPPKDAAALARDLDLLQKRHTTLQTLLDCLGAA
jgi:hypothetical protein